MPSFNSVTIMGNLCADVDLRDAGGTSVTDLRVAVNDRVKKGDEWIDEATFLTVTVWGRQAELCEEYLSKGAPILVHGRLKMDQWEDRDTGENRSRLKIVANSYGGITFVGGRQSGGEPSYSHDNGGMVGNVEHPAVPF